MPKFQVELEWRTVEVATALVEVEADNALDASIKAEEMANQGDVSWGKSEIVEGVFTATNYNPGLTLFQARTL